MIAAAMIDWFVLEKFGAASAVALPLNSLLQCPFLFAIAITVKLYFRQQKVTSQSHILGISVSFYFRNGGAKVRVRVWHGHAVTPKNCVYVSKVRDDWWSWPSSSEGMLVNLSSLDVVFIDLTAGHNHSWDSRPLLPLTSPSLLLCWV